MTKETIFADGLYFTQREGSPDFVKGSITINVAKFKEFVNKNSNLIDEKGYMRFVAKESRAGKLYVAVDTWKPDPSKRKNDELPYRPTNKPIDTNEEIPF